MKKIILLIFCVAVSCKLFSNGGPIMNSQVLKTGQIQLINNSEIKITDEKINAKISGEYVTYDISYTFFREYSYMGDTILYGFSVDFTDDIYNRNNHGICAKDVPYFEMYFNDKKLDVKEQIDFGFYNDSITLKNDTAIEHSLYWVVDYYHKKKWFIAKLIFDSTNTYTLHVKYKVHNYSTDGYLAKYPFMNYDKRVMIYDLSPAGYWGDGKIGNLSINIDASSLDSNYETHQLKGLSGYVLKDGIYSFQQKDFEPGRNKIFVCEYSYKNIGKTRDIKNSNISTDNFLSMRPSFKGNKAAVNDLNVATACNFKKSGSKKNSIEFTFAKHTMFMCLTILNGNYTSEKNYYDYGRLKKIRVEYEYSAYPDTNKIIKTDTVFNLDNKKYLPLNNSDFAKNCNFFDFTNDAFSSAIKLKITFLEYYAGKKPNDISISELLLNGFNRGF